MKIWGAVTMALIAVVCGVNLAHVVRRMPPPSHSPTVESTDVVMRHEKRLAAVRRALDARNVPGTIGYVADLLPAELGADTSAMEEYFISQFALAPRVLDRQPSTRRWAVANLHTKSAAERVPAGFRVVEDFGAGVLLLEQTTP